MSQNPYRTADKDKEPAGAPKASYEGALLVALLGWFAIVGAEPSGSRLSLAGLALLLVPVLVLLAAIGRQKYAERKNLPR